MAFLHTQKKNDDPPIVCRHSAIRCHIASCIIRRCLPHDSTLNTDNYTISWLNSIFFFVGWYISVNPALENCWCCLHHLGNSDIIPATLPHLYKPVPPHFKAVVIGKMRRKQRVGNAPIMHLNCIVVRWDHSQALLLKNIRVWPPDYANIFFSFNSELDDCTLKQP